MTDVAQSRSSTTRAPRGGERHGYDYDFLSREAFEAHIAAGEFLEWARVHEHLYGTSRQHVEATLATGRDVILVIDVQGAAQLRASGVAAVYVFILPPSWEVLEARLQARASESAAQRQQRLAVARQEVTHYTAYDYVIVNDQLPQAVDALKAIITAERHRVQRIRAASSPCLSTLLCQPHAPSGQR